MGSFDTKKVEEDKGLNRYERLMALPEEVRLYCIATNDRMMRKDLRPMNMLSLGDNESQRVDEKTVKNIVLNKEYEVGFLRKIEDRRNKCTI